MIDFDTYPSYNPYRPLALVVPPATLQQGADVYALQWGINAIVGSKLDTDGVLGSRTANGIHALQQRLGVTDDGVAGGQTQRAMILWLLGRAAGGLADSQKVRLVGKGQAEHEASMLIGNYSAKRDDADAPLGWSYDAGCCQMNTAHTDPALGFQPKFAVSSLVDHLRTAYVRYENKALYRGGTQTDRRRWALAAGAWNAPYWANWLAGVKPDAVPNDAQRATLEDYMAACIVYL